MPRLALLLLAITVATAQDDYCGTECEMTSPEWSCKQENTMCKYKTDESRCENLDETAWLDEDEKAALLKKHNDLRALVTAGDPPCLPPATNMAPMTWDDELARVAKRWAVQCLPSHDLCRNLKDGTCVGQNIWWQGAMAFNKDEYLKGVQAWYDEKKDYPPSNVGRFRAPEGKMVGHYTQLVWAKSTRLGCERLRAKGKGDDREESLYCNYAPAGNVRDEPVYEAKEGNYNSCTIAGGARQGHHAGGSSHLAVTLAVCMGLVLWHRQGLRDLDW